MKAHALVVLALSVIGLIINLGGSKDSLDMLVLPALVPILLLFVNAFVRIHLQLHVSPASDLLLILFAYDCVCLFDTDAVRGLAHNKWVLEYPALYSATNALLSLIGWAWVLAIEITEEYFFGPSAQGGTFWLQLEDWFVNRTYVVLNFVAVAGIVAIHTIAFVDTCGFGFPCR
jgi:hypothetical protein